MTEGDVSDMLEAADLLASEVPNARKVVFPGAAHLVSMEQPARFNELVIEFLERSG